MFLAQFLTVAIIHLLAVISPGPDFAVVTRNSLAYSRKVGVYTALGIALGIMVHVAYSLLGIGLIISQSVLLFSVIKYIGAAYLIYIGVQSLRAKPQERSEVGVEKSTQEISAWRSVRIGFLTNALNPKATLFFLALFTQVIDPMTPKYIQFLYGVEMMSMTFVWFALVALLFSNSTIRAKIASFQHHIERVTGVALVALGIKVAFTDR